MICAHALKICIAADNVTKNTQGAASGLKNVFNKAFCFSRNFTKNICLKAFLQKSLLDKPLK
jgi:hypothetical protein